MNDKYDTIQDPGHSLLGSGGGFGVVDVGVIGAGVCGLGRGLTVDDVTDLELSQHTDPLLQFVCGMRTEGLLQKAAIIFNRHIPGHFGAESDMYGLGVVKATACVVVGGGGRVASGT